MFSSSDINLITYTYACNLCEPSHYGNKQNKIYIFKKSKNGI